jgi:hypothetical protein
MGSIFGQDQLRRSKLDRAAPEKLSDERLGGRNGHTATSFLRIATKNPLASLTNQAYRSPAG